jgi:hypothetical protein
MPSQLLLHGILLTYENDLDPELLSRTVGTFDDHAGSVISPHGINGDF